MGRYGMSQKIRLHNTGNVYALPFYTDTPYYNPIFAHMRDMWVGLCDTNGIWREMKIILDDGIFKINFYNYAGTNLKIRLVE